MIRNMENEDEDDGSRTSCIAFRANVTAIEAFADEASQPVCGLVCRQDNATLVIEY
jgi:hypothetical protein